MVRPGRVGLQRCERWDPLWWSLVPFLIILWVWSPVLSSLGQAPCIRLIWSQVKSLGTVLPCRYSPRNPLFIPDGSPLSIEPLYSITKAAPSEELCNQTQWSTLQPCKVQAGISGSHAHHARTKYDPGVLNKAFSTCGDGSSESWIYHWAG